MSTLLNLWTQVRKTLRTINGGTGNTQGFGFGVIKVCVNRTGSDLVLGSLVRLTLDFNDARVELTDTDAEPDVVGVVVGYWAIDDPDTLIIADAPSPSNVAVQTNGTVRVNLDAAGATRGEYAFASGLTDGTAYSDATLAVGAFGIFQGSGSDTALVVLGAPLAGGSGGGGVTWGTPALTLTTANAAGSIDEAIRRDASILVYDATVPANIGTASAGSVATAARRNHVHGAGGGTPVTQAYSDAAATGSGPAAAFYDHRHGMPAAGGGTFGTPAIVLGTAAAAGSIDEMIRRDSTIIAFDATNPAATTPGDAAVVGTAAFAARRDHVHPRLSDTFAVQVVLDNGGVALTTGVKMDIYFPFACTIQEVTLLADTSGSIVLDLWVDTYANYPPTVADTITASAKPTISSATKSQDSTLTGWTTAIASGKSMRVNIDSITGITRLTMTLKCVRT